MATDEGKDMLAKRRRRLAAKIWDNHTKADGPALPTTDRMGNVGLFDNLAFSPEDSTYMDRMVALYGFSDDE